MRIVSLLPSATEILFAVGAGDDVVGVTFECDFPAEARSKRIVSTSTLPEGLGPAEIDAHVSERLAAGEDLYHLDEGALRDLDADLVVTQDLCAVCAVDVSVVDDALDYLGCKADVLTLDPQSLAEVLQTITEVGERVGKPTHHLVDSLHRRLDTVAQAVEGENDREPSCSSGPTHRSRPATGSPRWSPKRAARTSSAKRASDPNASPGKPYATRSPPSS